MTGLTAPPDKILPILRLVFSGGGAKGVVYPGVYRALIETGVIGTVEDISGSSVGSISAALIALGISEEELRHLLNLDFEQLMGRRVGRVFGKNEAGISFITKDGGKLLKFIRQGIKTSIQSYRLSIPNLEEFLNQHPEVKPIFDKLDGSVRPKFTFHDLEILHRIAPERFKRLTITGAVYPKCEMQIFNAEQTPDVEIALACRASCSIPGILKPVKIKIGTETKMFVDGGVTDNLPTDWFDPDENGAFQQNHKKDQTLVFAFAVGKHPNQSAVHRAIHTNSSRPCKMGRKERFERDFLAKKMTGITPDFSLVRAKQDGYLKLRADYALRVAELRVWPIETRHFALATKLSRLMIVLGYLDTINYVMNHDLYDCSSVSTFTPNVFLKETVGHFMQIYQAILLGANIPLDDDPLLTQLNDPHLSLHEQFYRIDAYVRRHVHSPAAFALTRTVEYRTNRISSETLFKDIYQESFKRSGFFSRSMISGECIFRNSTLQKKLTQVNLFGLFSTRNQGHTYSRTESILNALKGIPRFESDYQDHIAAHP